MIRSRSHSWDVAELVLFHLGHLILCCTPVLIIFSTYNSVFFFDRFHSPCIVRGLVSVFCSFVLLLFF